MDNAKNKIEALIPEIKRNGEKLRLLERNLDAEKLKLRRKIRKDENTLFHYFSCRTLSHANASKLG